MPLLDDETIDSLKGPGGWSHFSLYLLGALPPQHRAGMPAPTETEWRPRVLCSKVTKAHLRAIHHQAKWLRVPYAEPKIRVTATLDTRDFCSGLRNIRRLLQTALAMVDQELSE